MDTAHRRPPRRIAVVVSGWPRISETFVAHELLALRDRGMLAAVVATKPGDATVVQPQCAEIDHVPILVSGGAVQQGAELAARLSGLRVDAVHGYFAHQPAAVAQVAARLLGARFGFSVHALDARKVPRHVLIERGRDASIVAACNHDVASLLADAAVSPTLLPHGVDLTRFRPSTAPDREGVEVLAVGRLVDKKGFDVLIEAVQLLPNYVPIHVDVVGEGPNRGALERLIAASGVDGRVRLVGRRTHAQLPAMYVSADLVVVPSVIDRTGDRDGLPNVVLEAMASGRAVIASDAAAIGSAVLHGVTGLLVPPGDPAALSAAIQLLAGDRALGRAFGAAGRRRAECRYDLAACTRRFCAALERAYA